MKKHSIGRVAIIAAVAVALIGATSLPAQAYNPTSGTMYQLPASQACLKGRGNCAIYPKAAQLPDGRLVASFEQSTVPSSGSAVGQTLPVYKSDDDGTTWQLLSQVAAPAALSSNAAYAPYTSAWTNPYLYVLPQAVGNLAAGTLLMSAVVSGQDDYYTEHKAANSSWTPSGDGDRQNMAIALYSSTNNGVSWNIVNIITTGGWQGGSAGNIGANVSTANTSKEVDPVWEPYLMVYNGQLVAYYSDENDYTAANATTGALTLDPNNGTATDSDGQIIAHRTWNGTSTSWSAPVVDVTGTTVTLAAGKTEIGGGRPGMANVVQTSDGKWLLTYEYWGGGDNVRYKVSSSPLTFFSTGGTAGTGVTTLPVSTGSAALTTGGSPVLLRLPNGRIMFNAAGSGSVWIDGTGSSTGTWTQYQTTMPAAYSRSLTYDATTGRVEIIANQGTSTIVYADVDFGNSTGTYYKIVNVLTGQVIGTTNNSTDANIGNGDVPDVRLETAGSASNAATQLWHITTKSDGNVVLLNKSGGRNASIWTGSATAGQKIGQWVDNTSTGLFKMFTKSNGNVYFQSVQSPTLYLTGASTGATLTLQVSDGGVGSQDWQLVAG